jgi:hypothetical protein
LGLGNPEGGGGGADGKIGSKLLVAMVAWKPKLRRLIAYVSKTDHPNGPVALVCKDKYRASIVVRDGAGVLWHKEPDKNWTYDGDFKDGKYEGKGVQPRAIDANAQTILCAGIQRNRMTALSESRDDDIGPRSRDHMTRNRTVINWALYQQPQVMEPAMTSAALRRSADVQRLANGEGQLQRRQDRGSRCV